MGGTTGGASRPHPGAAGPPAGGMAGYRLPLRLQIPPRRRSPFQSPRICSSGRQSVAQGRRVGSCLLRTSIAALGLTPHGPDDSSSPGCPALLRPPRPGPAPPGFLQAADPVTVLTPLLLQTRGRIRFPNPKSSIPRTKSRKWIGQSRRMVVDEWWGGVALPMGVHGRPRCWVLGVHAFHASVGVHASHASAGHGRLLRRGGQEGDRPRRPGGSHPG